MVPSLTELLIDLSLQEQLIGRTRFCVHPKKEVADIPIMGGTKNPRIDKITAINPDIIIANKEENRKEDMDRLRQNYEVVITNIKTIEDALSTIKQLGNRLKVADKAEKLVSKIEQRLRQRPEVSPLKTTYFIWKDPWMTVGGDTYINDVMEHWKLENIFSDITRYPVIMPDELADYEPELILLSSEPYPFKEKHLPVVKEVCPDARVLLVEGEWFSWYGSHMVHSFGRLNGWRKVIA